MFVLRALAMQLCLRRAGSLPGWGPEPAGPVIPPELYGKCTPRDGRGIDRLYVYTHPHVRCALDERGTPKLRHAAIPQAEERH